MPTDRGANPWCDCGCNPHNVKPGDRLRREVRQAPMPWHDDFHEPRCVVASPKRMREIGRLYAETMKRGAA
jgi:hypothetical protein